MTPLSEHRCAKPRFARSINVERDSGTHALDGYLPVGRAIDVVTRFASALDRSDAEVAISITGPYGSGKSSLAIVVDALLGPKDDPAHLSAEDLLSGVAPEVLARLESARRRLGADQTGFIRAVVTAQREPVSATILRALKNGAERFVPSPRSRADFRLAVTKLDTMQSRSVGNLRSRPTTRELRELVATFASCAPVLLLIDEFGKNLEALADSHSDADLFLLQELAEWTHGENGIPLAILTLQHLSLDEYIGGTTSAQRREWAKIQGRFEDIAFVDSPAQTRALIAAAFGKASRVIEPSIRRWADEESGVLPKLGLADLASRDMIAACWPLHPIAVAALPELCDRYGQNERTLFSFLASQEPKSVGEFLADNEWVRTKQLPVVRLDRLYDYFLEAASTQVSVSANASRWVEIDARVRDATKLDEASRKLLKTVALLNLISAGGLLRASRQIVCHIAADGEELKDQRSVVTRLKQLEDEGLLTYREFADEFRVWQGSDFDLRAAVEISRQRLAALPAAELVANSYPLEPFIASRHSHQTGTLRAFKRAWIGPEVESIDPLSGQDRFDGLALYVLSGKAPTHTVNGFTGAKPTIFATAKDTRDLVSAALEVAAIDDVLASSSEITNDWVAQRELTERRVVAVAQVAREFSVAFASTATTWLVQELPTANWRSMTSPSPSSIISSICDSWYHAAPRIHNDVVNRHVLSSQGAKARRILLERMLDMPDQQYFGISDYGPERTLYRSIFEAHRIHHRTMNGAWKLCSPNVADDLSPAWKHIGRLLRASSKSRLRLSDIYTELAAPPFGIRDGVVPILVVAALLLAAEEVALYEHGTFRPLLRDDVLQRLSKNPENFQVRHFASRSACRASYLLALQKELGVVRARRRQGMRVPGVLSVVSSLVGLVNSLPEYSKTTQALSPRTLAVRKCLLAATEPDELIFVDLPVALGKPAVPASGEYKRRDATDIARAIGEVSSELRGAYPNVLARVRSALQSDVVPNSKHLRESLKSRAHELEGRVIDPRLERLITSLLAEIPDEESWLAYVAMNISGVPCESWSDSDLSRFTATIADVGATFRRIYALHADLGAAGDGFDAYRHVITRSNGDEVVHLVSVDERRRAIATPLLAETLSQVSIALEVSEDEARRVLVALLGEADFAARSQGSHPDASSEAYHRSERRSKGHR